jgi:hypothetical protein
VDTNGKCQSTTIFCPRYHDSRGQLQTNGRLDFKELLATAAAEGVRKITGWWLRRKILEQFRLAEELIENSKQTRIKR